VPGRKSGASLALRGNTLPSPHGEGKGLAGKRRKKTASPPIQKKGKRRDKVICGERGISSIKGGGDGMIKEDSMR